MRMDYRLDPPEPSECPGCGESYWPEDGGCAECGYQPLTAEDIADERAGRAYQRMVEEGAGV